MATIFHFAILLRSSHLNWAHTNQIKQPVHTEILYIRQLWRKTLQHNIVKSGKLFYFYASVIIIVVWVLQTILYIYIGGWKKEKLTPFHISISFSGLHLHLVKLKDEEHFNFSLFNAECLKHAYCQYCRFCLL